MPDLGLIIVLFAIGVLILVAEIFIPSHGVLTVAGVGFLVAAVVKTFQYGGRDAGVIATLACLVFLPVFAFVAIKWWPHTALGRRISPDNPVFSAADVGVPVIQLQALIGRRGRAVTALRPVGTCDFDGVRLSCVVEHGILDAGVEVLGTGIRNGNLCVVEVPADTHA